MRVTEAMLREHRACASQVRKFTELFPDGVDVTRELCVKHATDFDWDWAAENLLTAPARAAYEAATAPACAAYDAATAPARAAYDAAMASAWAEAALMETVA